MAQSLPRDRFEMERAGYRFLGFSKCKSCGAAIEWWLTTNGKKIPINPPKVEGNMREDVLAHFVTCPKAKDHRAPRPTSSGAAAPAPAKSLTERQTPELLHNEAVWFAKRHNARAVLVLCGGELQAWALRDGEDLEELRSDLITLANLAKRETEASR